MSKSPITLVKERFGADRKEAKAKLVATVRALATDDVWLARLNEAKGLDHVSNAKLLHLETVLTAVKKDHGGRAGLIAAILKLDKREKDAGYRARLESQSTPRLADHHRASVKRSA